MFATDFVSTKLHFTSLRAIFVWRELEEICLKLVLSEMEKWWWVAARPSQGLRGDKSSKMSQHSIPALHEYVIHSHILSEKTFSRSFRSRGQICVCVLSTWWLGKRYLTLSPTLQLSLGMFRGGVGRSGGRGGGSLFQIDLFGPTNLNASNCKQCL